MRDIQQGQVIRTGISKEEIKESFKLYSTMELINIKPIGTPYKSKALYMGRYFRG